MTQSKLWITAAARYFTVTVSVALYKCPPLSDPCNKSVCFPFLRAMSWENTLLGTVAFTTPSTNSLVVVGEATLEEPVTWNGELTEAPDAGAQK